MTAFTGDGVAHYDPVSVQESLARRHPALKHATPIRIVHQLEGARNMEITEVPPGYVFLYYESAFTAQKGITVLPISDLIEIPFTV